MVPHENNDNVLRKLFPYQNFKFIFIVYKEVQKFEKFNRIL